jgi:hypothetical protein
MWMSSAEALTWAGSADALDAAIAKRWILAHGDSFRILSNPDDVPPDLIPVDGITPVEWWGDLHSHEADYAADRVFFRIIERAWAGPTGVVHEILVVGLKLERAAVEALWPRPVAVVAEPKVEPKAEPKPERKPSGRPRGSVSANMKKIFQHFDLIVAREGRFHNQNSAVDAALSWAEKKGLNIDRRTIERTLPTIDVIGLNRQKPAKTGINY